MSKIKALKSEGYVTPRDYNVFMKFSLIKGRYYRFKVIGLIVLLTVITLTLAFLGWVKQEKTFFIGAGAILLCVFMFFYTVNTNVKRVCNKSAKVIRAKQRLTFGKNGFVFELLFKNEEENEYDEIFYDEVDNIYLAPQAMYIFIEKRSVLVVPKRNLNMSPVEAMAFLQKYVPAQKLVICV